MAISTNKNRPASQAATSWRTPGVRPAPRQRGTRESTRERLLLAAIELIGKCGPESLSTVNITEAAGFAQASFYMHFKNVDECLGAAAERVAGEVRAFIAVHRRRTHEAVVANATTTVAHFEPVLRLFLERRQLAEILVRHRHDRSPVGGAMRKMMEGLRADLIADSWSLACSLGIRRKHYQRVALTAEFILAQVMAAGEALLDGRFTDADIVAAELAATIDSTVQAALARCHD